MANPLFDALLAPHRGRDTAFLLLPDGGPIGYDGFLDLAGRIANALSALGLRAGDRVAVQAPKSPEVLALYAACVQAGVVLLPLNTAYTVAELRYFVEDSGAALLVCDPGDADALAPVAGECGAKLESLGRQGAGSLMAHAAALPSDAPVADRAGGDLAALLYTSGTTGRAKGAMLTQDNLLSNARALTDLWRFTDRDVLLHALPIFHAHGLFVATNVILAAGGAMILLPKFDLDAVTAQLPRATSMMGVPTFYTRLLDDPRLTRDLVAHMRLFISGSAPLLPETHERFSARSGHVILERYGMTETNMIASNPYEGPRRAGSVGFPLPQVTVRVTDRETGAPLPRGETGMIEVRGPNVFRGYWRMPEKTAQEMREDGFFITGDLGRYDADGYLHIVGRDKDLIISGGLNVYPVEIEHVLDRQPGVRESAVIGVPHPDLGEAVVGVLVPEAGAEPDPEAILSATAERLARFKQPRRLLLAEALPRNAMGKVQKAELRARHAGLFAPAGD